MSIDAKEKHVVRGRFLPAPLAPISRGWMMVMGGRIVSISPIDTPIPSDMPVIDHGDAVIFPGLIDTHCHLCLPGDGTLAERFLQTTPPEIWIETGCRNALRAMAAGITTVRDLGSPLDHGFTVRDRLQDWDGASPRVLISGAPLTVSGGHLSYFGGDVSGGAGISRRVDELADRGADVIKVIASGSGGPGQENTLPFSREDLRTIADKAHARGLSVAAHVTTPDAIEACLACGIDGLEHAGFWTATGEVAFREDLAQWMASQGVYVAPTIQAIYRTWRELPGQSTEDRIRRGRTFQDSINVLGRLVSFEMEFLAGTDAGWLLNPFGDLPLGLRLMVEAGMTPTAALASATTTAAAALGMEGEIGCLAPGAYADYLVLPGNPLEELEVLKRPCEVVVGGLSVGRGQDVSIGL